MTNARILSVLLAVAVLSGCDWSVVQPRYQLITATDGKIFRLDIKTGAVHYVTSDGMFPLTDQTPKLRIGEYYEMVDAKGDMKFLKYLGNGQFEMSKFAIHRRP